MLKDLLIKNRSYRRFYQEPRPGMRDLYDLVEAARLSPSARNDQPLKYILVSDPETCGHIFPCLAWAGYLTKWQGPAEHERPTAYIILLTDTGIAENASADAGIACQSILLTAVEKGFGGCILGSVNRSVLQELLKIDKRFAISYVIALGKPSEMVETEEIRDGDTRYYRDEKDIHRVPKRSLQELVLKTY
jgi:nitroreductase